MKTRSTKRRRPALEFLEGRTLLTAGALDTSFGGTGDVVTALTNPWQPQAVAVQSNLQTVVAGIEWASSTNAFPGSLAVVRYNVDGSLDTSFGNGGEVVLQTSTDRQSGIIYQNASVAIQPDGKIVVASNTLTENKKGAITACNLLVLRFNTNGTLDTSFGQNGEANIHLAQGTAVARAVAVLPTGQIVVAGMNLNGYAGPEFLVARLTSSGALDPTFGPNGSGYNYTTISTTTTFADSVSALGVDTSGDLLVGGMWLNPSTNTRVDQVVRYTPAGLIDTTFGNQGVVDLPFGSTLGVEGIGFQSTGQIIVGFFNPNADGLTSGVARLNPNGSIDPTFGSNGYSSDPDGIGAIAIAIQPNDEILYETILKTPASNSVLVDRLLPGGTLDPAFGTGGRVELPPDGSGTPDGITLGPDGKITLISTNSTSGVESITYRLLNDITSNTTTMTATASPTLAMAASAPGNGPTGLALAPLILDSPDLWDAFRPLTKRHGGS